MTAERRIFDFMKFPSNIYHFQNRLQRWVIGRRHALKRKNIPVFDPAQPPKKVLIVTAGLIGDTVMSIPGIIAARRVWQNAEITLLGKKHNCELLAACPLIDKFHEFQIDPLSMRYRHKIKELRSWLKTQKFDLGILLLADQYAHLLADAEIPIVVGAKDDWQSPCSTHLFEVGSQRTWGPKERLNSIRCLGYEVENIASELWVSAAAEQSAARKLKELNLTDGEKYAIIHPFGSTKDKWWQMEKISELAVSLKEKYDFRPLLIGGREVVADVPADLNRNVIDTTGKLTLAELMAVINNAEIIVSTDSGPYHIAGALNKKLIGLFRARRPEHGGYYANAKIIYGQNEQCQKLCQWDQCRIDPCAQLSRISVETVCETIEQFDSVKDNLRESDF